MANAGQMDRWIRIEVATEGPLSARGEAPKTEWTVLLETWAKKRDLTGDEAVRAMQLAAKVSTEFEIRYPEEVDPFPNPTDRMRLVDSDETVYNITHVSEIGRRRLLRILAWARQEAAA
jgi:SPP1 family predicted phage head-tail adaptor